MATKTGAGGEPQEYDTSTGQYGSGMTFRQNTPHHVISEALERRSMAYLSKLSTELDVPNAGEKAVPFSVRDIPIPRRLKRYLKSLTKSGDYISGKIGEFSTKDIADLTVETGVEFTSMTIGEKSYLIRGEERKTEIPQHLMRMLIMKKGTLDCHSHPFVGDLIPSENDMSFMKAIHWQKESVIVDPTNRQTIFTKDGILAR